MSSIQPFYNQPLPHSYVSRSACNPREISSLRILPVATGVCPHRKQKREQRVCVSSLNPRFFSNLQPLALSLRSFPSSRSLFSATYSLFSENTGVGGPVPPTCGANGQPLLVLPVPGGLECERFRAANQWRGPEPGGERGTVTSRTFVAAAGVVLGFALQDAAGAAQVLALLTSFRSTIRTEFNGEANLPLRRRRDAEKAGFSLRSR